MKRYYLQSVLKKIEGKAMWSEYALEVVDAVARTGSFSAAAQELHRVPSAVSYTVRQLEQWLAVPLFELRYCDVELTPAGALFIKDARIVIKKTNDIRRQCQQVANGWRGQLNIPVDIIVKSQRSRQLVVNFIATFPIWNCLCSRRCSTACGMRWWTTERRWRSARPVRCRWAAALPSATWLHELAVRDRPATSAGAVGGATA